MRRDEEPPALRPDSEGLGEAGSSPDDRWYRKLVENIRDYAIFFLDANGFVRSWNLGAERIKGYKAEEIIGQHVSRFYPEEAIKRAWPDTELALARSEGRIEDEGWRVRKDGTRFWANVIITALYDENRNVVGFSKVTRDLTERRRYEESLRQSEERFRLLLEGVTDYAIFVLDPRGLVESWNRGAERIQGYRSTEIIGKDFSLFYTPEDRAGGKPARELATAHEQGHFEDEGWRVRKNGSRFWATIVITPLHDADRQLYGYAIVIRDLSERKRVEALEEARHRIDEFLAMLGHELRNPLAPIRNAVEIMAMKKGLDPDLEWTRDVIERQVGHLVRLVDDLLDVSRITSGKITLQKEAIDLSDVMTRAVESSKPFIEARSHHLDVRYPKNRLAVMGDVTRLSQVLQNLLHNAAKYTPDGGKIVLSGSKEGDQAVMRVHDSGVGIAPELLTRIFDIFTQGHRTLDRSDGGLGIGLTLVRRLMILHGGSIEAYSEGLGKGSEFVVRLPSLEVGASADSREESTTSAASDAVKRVLVVDDNVDSLESMALLVRHFGHDVRIAHNGSQAVSTAAETIPEVILLDIGLPGMDGYEVARRIRSIPGLQPCRIIAMTGYGQETDRVRSRLAGFDDHLVKPVEPETLRKILRSEPFSG